MKLHSRWGRIFVVAYLSIFLFAEFVAFRSLILDTANSALSGVPAIFVTLPWSLMFAPFWNLVGFVKWYSRFAGTPALYGFFASLTIPPGAIINGAILYRIGMSIDHAAARSLRR